jgi:hypothetical protein
LLETTNPGVFAVGDVRHGSMKRVASAVGDGSTAIRLIHDYLALAPSVREGHEARLAHCRATLPRRLRCFTRHGRGIFVATWGAGRLITHTGRMKAVLVAGAAAQVAGVCALALVAGRGSLAAMIGPKFATGLGIGVLQQNVVLLVQNIIPQKDLGAGNGATQFSRFLGGALGVSALGALSAARVTAHVTSGLRAAGLPVPTGLNVSIPYLQALPRVAAAAYERGYALAFADTFRALIPFIVVPSWPCWPCGTCA